MSSICSKIAASGAAGTSGSSGMASSCGGISYAQFQTRLNNCLSMTSSTFLACATSICSSSSTSGSGGATCDGCTKADACCGALNGVEGGCGLKSACDAASGIPKTSLITSCMGTISGAPGVAQAMGKDLPDACK